MANWFRLCILGALLALTGSARAETLLKHYGGGYSSSINAYLIDVLKLTMEQTLSSHGDYRIEICAKPLSASRAKLEAERGVHINVLFSSHWTGHLVNSERMIRLHFPIFFSRLGLRELIVQQQDLAAFEALDSIAKFKQLRAGQGAGWPEVEILQANDIQVAEGHLFDALFAMLGRNRFDYLPLSILEARPALAAQAELERVLALEESLRIYYPVPFYLWVPADHPELVRRLQAGLQLAQQDGSLERLFSQHFSTIISRASARPYRLIVLDNPLIEPELNQQMISSYLETHRHEYTLLP